MRLFLWATLLAIAATGCAAITAPKPGTAADCVRGVIHATSSGRGQTKAARACAKVVFQMSR